jgi:S-adenosylmethionine hydrolase
MKGIILGLAPGVQIVDITHDIPSYDVIEASVVVFEACRYFPAGTIHVVVVDPGVGSARRPIALTGKGKEADQIFIAPDNGVLTLVSGSAVVRHITNASLFRNPVSQTFHGRDIFAPVAARLATGTPIESVGPTVTDFVTHSSSRNPTVLRVDKFGNLQTNLRRDQLGIGFAIRVGGIEVRRVLSSYSEALPGEIFAIEGSAGLIELCLNQESAANRLNLRRGAEFEVETGTLNQ